MNKTWENSPPVFICTGWELLADEDKFMAKKLNSDGVAVVFEEYEAMPHCFSLILPKLPGARRCFDGWSGFIKTVVENPTSITSKAVSIKAKSLEEVRLNFSSLSNISPEAVREKVHAQIAANIGAKPSVGNLSKL
jgi:alpha/beta hydrolase fold